MQTVCASSENANIKNCRETDQAGKVKWQNRVTCALSAVKSGIFKKTGCKREGQIVWQLDTFKAKTELRRHAEQQPNQMQ